jgi:hypothetical protein
MGGHFGRPRFRREKRKKFYRGVYLQLCSNLLYQKFVRKTIAPPRQLAGRGRNKSKNETARAQKILLGCGAKGNFLRPRRRGIF